MPAAPRDPYTVLGVDRSASAAEIRAAYRALVSRYHPDLHHGNPLEQLAGERMAEINQAYELLSDGKRRAAFDRYGVDPGGGASANAGAGAGAGEHASAGSAPPSRGGVRSMAKWGLLGLLIAALPFLLRGVVALVRALAGVEGEAFGVLSALRGTPAALVLALLAGTLLGWTLWRLRRRRQAQRRSGPSP